MSKEIVINNKGKQTRIAIVEDGELAELFIENQEHERTIGNIFMGRIRRVMPSIQAAFVDIGQKQDAFLHFSDLIENVESWINYAGEDAPVIGKFEGEYTTKPAGKKRRRPRNDRRGGSDKGHGHVADGASKDRRKAASQRQHAKHDARGRDESESGDLKFDPTQVLKKDQPILVKISKEPIANKGSRITTDISLAGRFLVLVPMANYVAVSKKIMSFKERRRLRALARSLLPEGFGVIVRTVADGRSAKALDTDLNLLIDKWKKIEKRLAEGPKPPAVIHEDVNMVSSIMRDLFTEDYDRILVDDPKLYRNLKGYVQAIAPDMVEGVKLEADSESVFASVGIKNSVEEAFEERVNLPSGGYLFIEQTEAMHVVDVNSGRAGRGLSQEESSLRVNIESAKVICKQVRLRDLGGIIVVDFIDMRNEGNKRKLYETLKREFRNDRAVTKVLPMSDFGLVQITRQRLRPSITKTFSLPDGSQEGAGETPQEPRRKRTRERSIEPSHLRVDPDDLQQKIEEWLAAYKESGRSGKVRLRVHPFTQSYLSGGFPSRTFRWRLRFGVRVTVEADTGTDPMTFRFFDEETGKEISRMPRKDRRGNRRGKRDDSGRQKDSEKRGDKKEARSSDNRRKGNRAEKDSSDDRRGRSRDGSDRRGRSKDAADSSRKKDQSRRGQNGQKRDDRRKDDRQKDERQKDDRRQSTRGDDRKRDSSRRSENADGPKSNGRRSRSGQEEGRAADNADARKQERSGRGQGRSKASKPKSEWNEETRNVADQADAPRSGNDGSSKQDAKRTSSDRGRGRKKDERAEQKPKDEAQAPVAAPVAADPDNDSGQKSAPVETKPETTSSKGGESPRPDETSSQKREAEPASDAPSAETAKSVDSEKTVEPLPASNRFVKIDLRTDKDG